MHDSFNKLGEGQPERRWNCKIYYGSAHEWAVRRGMCECNTTSTPADANPVTGIDDNDLIEIFLDELLSTGTQLLKLAQLKIQSRLTAESARTKSDPT